MDTRILLTDSMLTGPNGAAIVAVLQGFAPDNVELIRLEMLRNPATYEMRVYLYFKRKGEREELSVSVKAGYYMNRNAYLDHQLLLSKLALVA